MPQEWPPGMPTNKNQPNTRNSSNIPHTIISSYPIVWLETFKWAKSSMSTKPAITASHCHPHDSRAPGSTCLLTLDKSMPDTLGTSCSICSKCPLAMLLWCETLGILNTKTWRTKSALYPYYIYIYKLCPNSMRTTRNQTSCTCDTSFYNSQIWANMETVWNGVPASFGHVYPPSLTVEVPLGQTSVAITWAPKRSLNYIGNWKLIKAWGHSIKWRRVL